MRKHRVLLLLMAVSGGAGTTLLRSRVVEARDQHRARFRASQWLRPRRRARRRRRSLCSRRRQSHFRPKSIPTARRSGASLMASSTSCTSVLNSAGARTFRSRRPTLDTLGPPQRASCTTECDGRRLQLTRLYVTHDPEDAAPLGDRMVEMRQGRVVAERHLTRVGPRSSPMACELPPGNAAASAGARASIHHAHFGARLDLVLKRRETP